MPPLATTVTSARAFALGVPARALYAAATDCEGPYASAAAVRALQAELDAVAGPGQEPPAVEQGEVADWAEGARTAMAALGAGASAGDLVVRRAVLAGAPLGLVAGAWLQWCTAPANAHDESALAALALYADDVDVANPHNARGDAYLELLRQLHLGDHASPAARLEHDHRIPDGAFRIPAVLLAISRRPDDFFPEILGADLCLRTVGLPPPLAVLREAGGAYPDWPALDLGQARDPGRPGGLAQSRAAIERLLASSPDGSAIRRVAKGFRWVRATLAEWTDRLRRELESLDPAREMGRLLRRRAHEGAMYHHDFVLDGRPLSRWLAESGDDPRPLLDALAGSPLIRPGDAARSPLVTSLVGHRGPMFRVFTTDDLSVMRHWIDALPVSGNTQAVEPPAGPPTGFPASTVVAVDDDRVPASTRDAYHLLQSRTVPPSLARWAEGYVRDWLASVRPTASDPARQLPEHWEPGALRPWLARQHDLHAQEFEQAAPDAVTSREVLIDSTVQTAPLTLIDGAWLRGFADYQCASSELGRYLFGIYWDELGNGVPHLNHPRIYRALLEQMEVMLPPTRSPEFAASPLLRDASFDLPVLWLAIGLFPRTFGPEIAGLNLAVELSGVGGGYRLAHLSLRHHGFDTQFVDLHNAIDNVLTGHSAWAAEAVEVYVAGVGELQGPRAQQDTWQRLRAGYAAIDPRARQGRGGRRRRRRRQAEEPVHP